MSGMVPNLVANAISNAAQTQQTFLSLNGKRLNRFPKTLITDYDESVGCINLDLSNNHLKEIPPEIGHMQDLIEINLSDNDLSTLPSTLGLCANLKWINLDMNKFQNDPQLKQAYRNCKVVPSSYPDQELSQMRYCRRGGRWAGPVLELLRSRLPPNFNHGIYTGNGTHSHSSTQVPAGVVCRGSEFKFNDEWGEAEVAQARPKRGVNFGNQIANNVNYKPHDEWGGGGGEEYRPMKLRNPNAPKNNLEVVGDTSYVPEIRAHKRQQPGRNVVKDKVVGVEWGSPSNHAQQKAIVRAVVEPTSINSFGCHPEGSQKAKRKVLKEAPNQRHLREDHNVLNQDLGRSFDHYGHDDYRVGKRIVGEELQHNRHREGNGIFQLDGAFDGHEKPRGWGNVGSAPQDQFSLAPDGRQDEQRRKLKPVGPQDRFNRTSGDQFVLAHGATEQLNFEGRRQNQTQSYGGQQPSGQLQRQDSRSGSVLSGVQFQQLNEIRGLNHGYQISQVINELSMTNAPLKQFQALDNVRWLVKEDPRLFANMNQIFQKNIGPRIVECVNNHKHENLCINAMICITDIFRVKGSKIEEECDSFIPSLLNRNTCKKSLAEPAKAALVAIAISCQPGVVLPKLYAHALNFNFNDPGQPDKCGWALYAIREAVINADHSFFTNNNTQNAIRPGENSLATCIDCLTKCLSVPWEGMKSLAYNTFEELCKCLADAPSEQNSVLNLLESCIRHHCKQNFRMGQDLVDVAKKIFNQQV